MLRLLAVLMGYWCVSLTGLTATNQELLQNLSTRMHELPQKRGSLIKSFTNHSQSYIYDQALAIITFSKAKEKNKARLLLLGLKSLQMKDGSLYFSYYLDGASPYPIEGDKRFAGAIAWVALAASHYQHAFKSQEFVSFNARILSYLNNQIVPLSINGEQRQAVRFAPYNIKSTAWDESKTVALEHNLDAYAAFKHFTTLNKASHWNQNIHHLKDFILTMWDRSRSHFWSGADVKTGLINKDEMYLDNQSWTLLALETEAFKKINPKLALDLNCESFYVEQKGILGFMDSKPTRRPASSQFVWSEGSFGQILAMRKFEKISSQKFLCNKRSSEEILKSLDQMKTKDGGIAYATPTPNPDFTTASSVAGTAWLYFAANDLNPFEL